MHELAPHHGFQYPTPEDQADTAQAGMWLFLATEVMFFGALFLTFLVCRHQHPDGFRLAASHTNLTYGTINTVLLVTSSAVFTGGLALMKGGRTRPVLWTSLAAGALGALFLVLKGFEWAEDFNGHLFPGPGFGLTGPDSGGAQIFYAFYFVATGLHGVHMLIGLGLVAWLARKAKAGEFDRGWQTPVEVVGLYWSFVDMVWLIMYPLIYLVGRA